MDLMQEHQKQSRQYIISGALWLFTTVLGIIALLAGRRAILSTLMRFFMSGPQSTQNPNAFMNILVSFPLTFLAIAIIIGGFEFHLRDTRLGSEQSWKLFAQTIAVEAGFLLIATFL